MTTLQLKVKEERRLLRGHLWVYRNELMGGTAAGPLPQDGEIVEVVSAQGRFVGRGFYQAQGGIAVRLLTHKDEAVDAGLFRRRIIAAKAFRDQLFPGEQVYRWLFGESDRLPGLVADRYGEVVSMQSACGFYESVMADLASAFLEHDGVNGVHAEIDGRRHAFGDSGSLVEAVMNDLRFQVDVVAGQKTGMFLDQRVNARAMRPLAQGVHVLDGHCHVGQWSLNAAQAGAASVLGVDTSAKAIDQAHANAELNGLEQVCRFECSDIAEVLQRGGRYGLVILDPPALAKTRSRGANAKRLYQALNQSALKAVEPGGYLVTSCCSHFVSREEFLESVKRASRAAQRAVWLLDVKGAPADHPALLAMPETAYLTCAFLRVF